MVLVVGEKFAIRMSSRLHVRTLSATKERHVSEVRVRVPDKIVVFGSAHRLELVT